MLGYLVYIIYGYYILLMNYPLVIIQWQFFVPCGHFKFDVYFVRYCREGNGNPLQYSCLENPMGRGAWWDAVHGVVKSRTRLSDFTFTLSDMSVATVALLFFICIKYLFPSFHFDSMCVSKPEVSPYRNHIVEFFF